MSLLPVSSGQAEKMQTFSQREESVLCVSLREKSNLFLSADVNAGLRASDLSSSSGKNVKEEMPRKKILVPGGGGARRGVL